MSTAPVPSVPSPRSRVAQSAAHGAADAAALDVLAGLRAHPRLLLTPDRVAELQTLAASDPQCAAMIAAQARRADYALTLPLPTRRLDGVKRFRLLETSREVLSRVLTLGISWRLEPKPAWRDRLQSEIESVLAFSDWHPDHFLDTAEMTAAVAIAYDWLYHELDDETRTRWSQGLIRHGLTPGSNDAAWWVTAHNNWNQVCHSGMILGALAVAEDEPALAQRLIQRAYVHIPIALAAYAPVGVYPEGPTYWGYGTAFTVLTVAALQSALGHDGGICASPGFRESFTVVAQCHGPTGLAFNYGDSGLGIGRSSLHLWAARHWHYHALAQWAWPEFATWLENPPAFIGDTLGDRFLPLALVWYTPVDASAAATVAALSPTCIARGGKVELALLRTQSNDPAAAFMGFKAGMLEVNHGHLDLGSFVFEVNGVRWAHDFGMEKEIYDRNDSWALDQESARWHFLRANNHGHNTLTINSALQQVAGIARLGATASNADRAHAVIDLSPTYAGHAQQVQRGVALIGGRRHFLLQDDIIGATGPIRWTWITRAHISLAADGREAVLRENGQRLTVVLHSALPEISNMPAKPEIPAIRFTIRDCLPPTAAEHQNAGFQRLIIDIPPGDAHIQVLASPGDERYAGELSPAVALWAHGD